MENIIEVQGNGAVITYHIKPLMQLLIHALMYPDIYISKSSSGAAVRRYFI